MQDYINLINFLKENDEEVKKDLETLKFGTIININKNGERYFLNRIGNRIKIAYIHNGMTDSFELKESDNLEILGNNLDYHHIMMYCTNTKLLQFNFYGDYIFIKNVMEIGKDSGLIEIDITKPLHEQEPIVYKQLLGYFIGLQ